MQILNEHSTHTSIIHCGFEHVLYIRPLVLFGNFYILHIFVSIIIMVMTLEIYILNHILLYIIDKLHIRLFYFFFAQNYIFCSCNLGGTGRSFTYPAAALSVPNGR
jgi:hypothetical protein